MAIKGDDDAKKQMIEIINNNSSYSEKEKNEEIQMLNDAQDYYKKTKEQATNSSGKTNTNKFRKLLLEQKAQANNNLAKATLHALSTASESFAKAHQGNFPASIDDLIKSIPPYLFKNYCQSKPLIGFIYHCEFSKEGYILTATPEKTEDAGSLTFIIKTGGILSQQK